MACPFSLGNDETFAGLRHGAILGEGKVSEDVVAHKHPKTIIFDRETNYFLDSRAWVQIHLHANLSIDLHGSKPWDTLKAPDFNVVTNQIGV